MLAGRIGKRDAQAGPGVGPGSQEFRLEVAGCGSKPTHIVQFYVGRMATSEISLSLPHPAWAAVAAQRADHVQLNIADAITAFAGSMPFVYIHAALFAAWMLFFEASPWPTLTLIVSLEAIFLSTFVMIGQNRQAAFAKAKADHDFNESELELKTNTDLTRQIHDLTVELHRRVVGHQSGTAG